MTDQLRLLLCLLPALFLEAVVAVDTDDKDLLLSASIPADAAQGLLLSAASPPTKLAGLDHLCSKPVFALVPLSRAAMQLAVEDDAVLP